MTTRPAERAVVWARRPGVLWRLAGESVIVRRAARRDVDAESQLMGAAAVIWLELDEARTEAELADALTDAGAPDPDDALHAALELLSGARLIEQRGP